MLMASWSHNDFLKVLIRSPLLAGRNRPKNGIREGNQQYYALFPKRSNLLVLILLKRPPKISNQRSLSGWQIARVGLRGLSAEGQGMKARGG
jgi:hypothetical protein